MTPGRTMNPRTCRACSNIDIGKTSRTRPCLVTTGRLRFPPDAALSLGLFIAPLFSGPDTAAQSIHRCEKAVCTPLDSTQTRNKKAPQNRGRKRGKKREGRNQSRMKKERKNTLEKCNNQVRETILSFPFLDFCKGFEAISMASHRNYEICFSVFFQQPFVCQSNTSFLRLQFMCVLMLFRFPLSCFYYIAYGFFTTFLVFRKASCE